MKSGVSHLPGDRHGERVFGDLSVRENFSARSPAVDITAGFVRRGSGEKQAKAAADQFAVKTPGPETPIRSLWGGNQKKLVLASVLAMKPRVLLVNEPTQGVDVGARAGVAVLEGDRVVEDNITAAVLKSTSHREKAHKKASRLLTWAAGNTAPLVMVLAAILLLTAVGGAFNPFYVSPRNLMGMATLIATLAMVAYGQQTLLLVGGGSCGAAAGIRPVSPGHRPCRPRPWLAPRGGTGGGHQPGENPADRLCGMLVSGRPRGHHHDVTGGGR